MKRPVNIERNCLKIITNNLKVAQNQFKKVKQNAATHREDHLRQQAEEYEVLGNITLARHLQNLITIEQQKEVHQHIGKFTKKQKSSNIKYINIPIDHNTPLDKIPKDLSDTEWQRLDQPEDIERCINKRNSVQLHQTHGTTCTIEHLKSLLGVDSLTTFGDEILQGTSKLDDLGLTNL